MPDPTPIVTGYGGQILIGAATPGDPLTGYIRQWRFRESFAAIESRGGGLGAAMRIATKGDWEASGEVELTGVTDVETIRALLGLDAYVCLTDGVGSSPGAYFTDTGLLMELEGTAGADDVIVCSFVVRCNRGVVGA